MYGIYENGVVIAKFVVPMTVKSNHPIFVSDTLSLKRQMTQRTAQRWEIETKLEPLHHNAQDLMVNLVTKGWSETVSVLMPQNTGVIHNRNESGSTATVLTNAAVGADVVNTTGSTIIKGTFIKFTGHSKIYMVTANAAGLLTVYPKIRAAIAEGTTLQHKDNVVGSFLYDTDVIRGMSFSDGLLMDMGTVKLVERL